MKVRGEKRNGGRMLAKKIWDMRKHLKRNRKQAVIVNIKLMCLKKPGNHGFPTFFWKINLY